MVFGSSRCRALGAVVADGAAVAAVDAAAVDGLEALALGLGGQRCGVCAEVLAFDVWAAMASATVGPLRGVGPPGV